MSTRIVIFGANGFIGRHLVTELAKSPENDIVAFDRFSQASPFQSLQNVRSVAGDFLNKEDIEGALDNAEYVFHLVSTTNPAISAKDPYIDIDTNIKASVTLFDLCIEKGVKRIIFPSSGGTVYGNADTENIDEMVLPEPVSPYGIGKLTIEHYLRYFKVTKGLDYIVFRIANPYGPGQNLHGTQGVIPIFLNAALNHETLTIFGDGSMVRDYIYIEDLIKMLVSTYDKPHKYDLYNIGSGTGSSINDIIESIKRYVKEDLNIQHQPSSATFVNKIVLDTDRFNAEFSPQTLTTLDAGIMQTLNYIVEKDES